MKGILTLDPEESYQFGLLLIDQIKMQLKVIVLFSICNP